VAESRPHLPVLDYRGPPIPPPEPLPLERNMRVRRVPPLWLSVTAALAAAVLIWGAIMFWFEVLARSSTGGKVNGRFLISGN